MDLIKRKFWLSIHRYIGLWGGVLFVLIGLTGSLLAFRQNIDEYLNSQIMIVDINADDSDSYKSFDELLNAAIKVIPAGSRPEVIRIPSHKNLALSIGYSTIGHDFYDIFVNPYTAEIVGQRIRHSTITELSQPFIYLIRSLHYTFLLGRNHSEVVGILGVFVLFALIAGFAIWWPNNGNWRKAFSIKYGGSKERFIFDLHKVFGVFSGVLLIVITLTGIALIFSSQTQSFVRIFSTVNSQKKFYSTKVEGLKTIGIDQSVLIAKQVFNDGNLQTIILPSNETDVFKIGIRSDDEVNKTFTKRVVTIEQFTGKVLDVRDPMQFSNGEILISWLYPIHSGEIFGDFGRVLVSIIGIMPLVLLVTGMMRWLQKRRARKLKDRAKFSCYLH